MRSLIASIVLCVISGIIPGFVMAAGSAVTYQVNGAQYEGYYVSPAADAPLVLLVHDWDGLTDYEIKRSEMLAKLGYAVFAVDLFGKGIRPTETADKRRLTGGLYRDRKKMRALMYGAVEAAKAQGANTDRMVVAGYCFGGAAVLEFARAGAPARGFATFHGALATPEGQDYKATKAKVLVMHGSADTAVTLDDFSALAKQLEAAGVPHEMITYGGAPHAFTVFGAPSYRAEADHQSWKRFVGFLDEQLQ